MNILKHLAWKFEESIVSKKNMQASYFLTKLHGIFAARLNYRIEKFDLLYQNIAMEIVKNLNKLVFLKEAWLNFCRAFQLKWRILIYCIKALPWKH